MNELEVPGRGNLVFYIGMLLAAVAGMFYVGVILVGNVVRDARRSQPITIEACAPEEFNGTRCPEGYKAPFQDEDAVFELTEDLTFEVAGRVVNDSNEDIAYEVTVSWVAVEDDGTRLADFPVIDVPVTWEAGRNEPYTIEWVPPQQLLATGAAAEPGTSLGRWRIVGDARPVDEDRYSRYVWTSVGTFELVAAGG